MVAKDIVDLGSWWVIGNGNVLIYGRIDGIPIPDSFKIVSPRVPLKTRLPTF